MPVVYLDPVHEKVKHDKPPTGCRGPKSEGYWVKERQYKPDGRYEMVDRYIKDVMSDDCRGAVGWKINGEWQRFPECEGCTRKEDEEHVPMARKAIDDEFPCNQRTWPTQG